MTRSERGIPSGSPESRRGLPGQPRIPGVGRPDKRPKTRGRATISPPVIRLLRDETGVTATEYIVATLAVALGAVAGSAAIAGILISYLHRIYLVVTLPIP